MMRKKLYLTVKMWNRYDDEDQEKILRKYDVILTDHKTAGEKLSGLLKSLLRPTVQQRAQQRKKLNRSIGSVTKGIDQFDKMMDDLSDGLRKSVGSPKADVHSVIFGGRNRDASFLTGHKRRKSF